VAATDAKPLPIKNVAYRVTFPILDADGDLVPGAAGLDSEVSKDAGTFGDCTSESTEIATASGVYYLDLTATEMNADTVAIIVKTSTTDAKTTVLVLYPQESGDIKVDLQSIGGTANNPNSAQIGVNVVTAGGTGWGSGAIHTGVFAAGALNANALATDAADEIGTRTWLSGTRTLTSGAGLTITGVSGNVGGSVGSVVGGVGGDIAGNVNGNVLGSVFNVISPVSVSGGTIGSVSGSVGSVAGSVGSVTGSVGGNVAGSVGSVAGSVAGNVVGSVGSVVSPVTVAGGVTVVGVVDANLVAINGSNGDAQDLGALFNDAIIPHPTLYIAAINGTPAINFEDAANRFLTMIQPAGGSTYQYTEPALALGGGGGGGGSSGGTGAFAITVTVTDGTNPLAGANVRVSVGIDSFIRSTDASGEAPFYLDAGSYTVGVTKSGHDFPEETRTVTGNEEGTLTDPLVMTATVIPGAPSDPAMCLIYGTLRETQTNQLLQGVAITATRINTGMAYAGGFLVGLEKTAISDENGFVQLEVPRSDLMIPTSDWRIVCLPAQINTVETLNTATFDLSTII
jgi:hypothetical protein